MVSGHTMRSRLLCDASMRAARSLRRKHTSSSTPLAPAIGGPLASKDIPSILAKPTWSVSSLLAPSTTSSSQPTSSSDDRITPARLHHLLRLSALPLPCSAEEEVSMIRTLEAQLHFVRAVQEVDTTGVEPLVVIRDETDRARREAQVTIESLQGELEKEERVGLYGRIRRKKEAAAGEEDRLDGKDTAESEIERARREDMNWDPLARAPEKVGRFIKVNTDER